MAIKKMFWDVKRDGHSCTMTCPECGDWFVIADIPGEAEGIGSCPSCGTILTVCETNLHHLYNSEQPNLKCRSNCEFLHEKEDEDGSCGYCKMLNGRFIGFVGNINLGQCICIATKER